MYEPIHELCVTMNWKIYFPVIACILFVPAVQAQPSASIVGRVLLNGVQPIANADITYYNTATGLSYTSVSDLDGYYWLNDMELPVEERTTSSNTPITRTSGATNPVGAGTSFYFLHQHPIAEVDVYDILGRRVLSIPVQSIRCADQWFSSGYWNGACASGVSVANGRYFVVANYPGQVDVIPVIHLRDGGAATLVHSQNPSELLRRMSCTSGDITGSMRGQGERTTALTNDFAITVQPGEEGPLFEEREFVRTLEDGFNPMFTDTVRATQPARVLFIGNSYTNFNDGMDTHLQALTDMAHPEWPCYIERAAFGGYSLQDHYQNDYTMERVREGEWDLVILQGSSISHNSDPEYFYLGVRQMKAAIDSTGAQTALFMTWADEYHPRIIEDIIEIHETIADQLDIPVYPVGIAWENTRIQAPDLNLYHEDGYHPNLKGTYLSVCVFYAAIYSESPEEQYFVDDAQIPLEKQLTLQQIAWETVISY